MSLWKEIEKLKQDKRLTDWHVAQGKVSKEELEKHLQSLPDSASNVDTFRLNEDGSERALSGAGLDDGDQAY